MSALTEKVAREHRHTWIDYTTLVCLCGEPMPDHYAHEAHIAEATEAAVRAAVAADIREQRFIDADPDWNRSSDEAAFDDALNLAAKVAEEGS